MIEGTVAVSGTADPSMAIVRDDTDSFESLAARYGGVFDGWEASAN